MLINLRNPALIVAAVLSLSACSEKDKHQDYIDADVADEKIDCNSLVELVEVRKNGFISIGYTSISFVEHYASTSHTYQQCAGQIKSYIDSFCESLISSITIERPKMPYFDAKYFKKLCPIEKLDSHVLNVNQTYSLPSPDNVFLSLNNGAETLNLLNVYEILKERSEDTRLWVLSIKASTGNEYSQNYYLYFGDEKRADLAITEITNAATKSRRYENYANRDVIDSYNNADVVKAGKE